MWIDLFTPEFGFIVVLLSLQTFIQSVILFILVIRKW